MAYRLRRFDSFVSVPGQMTASPSREMLSKAIHFVKLFPSPMAGMLFPGMF